MSIPATKCRHDAPRLRRKLPELPASKVTVCLALVLFATVAHGQGPDGTTGTTAERGRLPAQLVPRGGAEGNADSGEKSIPLPPPGQGHDPSRPGEKAGGPATTLVAGSLAVVIGLFLLVAWAWRRAAPRSSQPLPRDAVQVWGRLPLGPKHHLQLIQVANKILLVSVTPQGAETLTEVEESGEVERLRALCAQAGPNSVSATFRRVLHDAGQENANASVAATGHGGR